MKSLKTTHQLKKPQPHIAAHKLYPQVPSIQLHVIHTIKTTSMKHLYLYLLIGTVATSTTEAFSSGVSRASMIISSSSSSVNVNNRYHIHQRQHQHQRCTFGKCQTTTQVKASASSDNDNNNDNDKSIFEQAFGNIQMPWEDNNSKAKDDQSESSQQQWQQQWWPANKSSDPQPQPQESQSSKAKATATGTPRKLRKPRVPRYPSALQTNLNIRDYDSQQPSSSSSGMRDDASSSNAADDDGSNINNMNISTTRMVADTDGDNDKATGSTTTTTLTPSSDVDVDGDVEKYVKLAGSATSIDKVIATTSTTQEQDESPIAVDTNINSNNNKPPPRAHPKLGILLIDHGSKRQKSNEFLINIAQSYQSAWDDSSNAPSEAVVVVVEGAHMEIAPPSIYTQLRKLITQDEVTTVICVPYFLSPGKHATIDVPNLINEAVATLDNEGLLDYNNMKEEKKKRVQIVSSKTLGSNVKSMLGVVDVLVQRSLKNNNGDNEELRESVLRLLASRDDEKQKNTVQDKETKNDKNNSSSILKGMEEELRKYTNRATLLETTLEGKINTRITQIYQ